MKLMGADNYDRLMEPLRKVTVNDLFAWSVIERHVSGRVYVDDLNDPRTYYVVHPYGMSLLFGDWRNKDFNDGFRDYALNRNLARDSPEWMQAFPCSWDGVLGELFEGRIVRASSSAGEKEGGIIELNTRVNFRFSQDKYLSLRGQGETRDVRLSRTDKRDFSEMKGSVVPYYFWNNADHFTEEGVGFSLFWCGRLASIAFSSYVHADQLEIGIETVEGYRSRGFARLACSALIDYCLENNLEPVWSCRLENTASYRLALSLGFEPVLELPYYRLGR